MRSCYACLQKHDTATGQHWFYILCVQPTLFGGWSLMREWGRIGAEGQVKVDWHVSQEGAEAAFEALLRSKQESGYRETHAG